MDGLRVGRIEWVLRLASHGGNGSLPCAHAASGHEVISFYNDMPLASALTSASHSCLAEASSDLPLENSCPRHVVGPLGEPAVVPFHSQSGQRVALM